MSGSFSSLPADLQALADTLAGVENRTHELIRDLPEAAFHWQPNEGRSWSLAQCLDHLTLAADTYLGKIGEALAAASPERQPRRGPIAPGWFSRWFLGYLEPSSTRRLPAPKKIVPPAESARRPRAEIWSAYQAAHARVVEAMKRAAPLDLNRVRFTNPFFPLWRVTLGTGFTILATHERRHLEQMERVTKAAGFPG
jgi:hypothetical protein